MPTMELPGIFTMSITPFGTDGKLDEAGLRDHLRRVASAGCGVLLGSPGSGEGQVMDTDELRRLYEIGVDELKGKVPAFAAGRESRGAKLKRACGSAPSGVTNGALSSLPDGATLSGEAPSRMVSRASWRKPG